MNHPSPIRNSRPKLCLGTAQFGSIYGITNKLGQITSEQVSSLLCQAYNSGIYMLDTAQSYGNAEEVIGQNISKKPLFQVVSKLAPQKKSAFESAMCLPLVSVAQISYAFSTASIEKLNLDWGYQLGRPGFPRARVLPGACCWSARNALAAACI